MAVFPNSDCYFLCEWMLSYYVPRLTGPQQTLTALVQAAALAQTSVTDNEWKDFQNYAQWRNPYYLVYRDYQTSMGVDLITGLQNYYAFEGNSNDSVGSLNGADTAVTYSTSYGIIAKGVQNNSTSGKIVIGYTSDFNYIHETAIFAVNIWFRGQVLNGSCRVIGTGSATANKGFQIVITQNSAYSFEIYNGNVGAGWVFRQLGAVLINDLSWHMITFTGNGSAVYCYLDAQKIGYSKLGTLPTGNATGSLTLFQSTGGSGSNTMNLDELGIWNRELNFAEITALYNGGAGLTYPF